MIYHNGTTGSEAKFDRWTDAQADQMRHEQRQVILSRYGEPLSPAWLAERDRLAEIADATRIDKENLGTLCFSLLRLRERATEQARADVLIAIQPLVDKYQGERVIAEGKFNAANRELVAFIMGRV